MVARLSPLFELAPTAQAVVMFFGATTALFARPSASSERHQAHRGLSTCRQLGLMFVAMGAGLTPSACSICSRTNLLQGAVVPGVGLGDLCDAYEQDIRNMGGLWRQDSFHVFVMSKIGTPGIDPDFRLRRLIFQGRDHRIRLRLAQSDGVLWLPDEVSRPD